MGSLIKNGGGCIVPAGGYVAGRADIVDAAAARVSAPGVGRDAGAIEGQVVRTLLQGLWLAPAATAEAIKGGALVAATLGSHDGAPGPDGRRGLGLRVIPPLGPPSAADAEPRVSVVTAVELGSPDLMSRFCRAVQRASPVGSFVTPVPGATAGYSDEVLFADGSFVDGSTAELSADGPLREPYAVYTQGGSHWTQWAHALEGVVAALEGAEEE